MVLNISPSIDLPYCQTLEVYPEYTLFAVVNIVFLLAIRLLYNRKYAKKFEDEFGKPSAVYAHSALKVLFYFNVFLLIIQSLVMAGL